MNAPDEWVSLLVGRPSSIEMLAGVLRSSGLRVNVRDAGDTSVLVMGRDVATELLVHQEDEGAARRVAQEMNLLGEDEGDDASVEGTAVDGAEVEEGGAAASPGEPDVFRTDDEADEEASTAMSRLFGAADRLRKHPDDLRPLSDLTWGAGVVAESGPPYGISPVWWQTLRDLASGLCAATSGAESPDDVAISAEALRAHLRDYV